MQFVSKNPFAGYHIDARRARKQAPGVVGNQGVKFSLHSWAPIGIWQGVTNGARERRHRHNVEVETIHRLCNASFASGAHRMRVVDWSDGDRPRGQCAARGRGATGSNLYVTYRGSSAGRGQTGRQRFSRRATRWPAQLRPSDRGAVSLLR